MFFFEVTTIIAFLIDIIIGLIFDFITVHFPLIILRHYFFKSVFKALRKIEKQTISTV